MYRFAMSLRARQFGEVSYFEVLSRTSITHRLTVASSSLAIELSCVLGTSGSKQCHTYRQHRCRFHYRALLTTHITWLRNSKCLPGVPRVTQSGRLLARGRPDEGTKVLHSDIGDGDRRVLVARIDSFCVKLRLHRRPAQAAHLRCESELSWDARGSGG